MNAQTIAFVQARMSSQRFRGKVLADLCGKPMIISMLQRVQHAKSIDKIVLLTSTDASDDQLESVVTAAGFSVFRGPLFDVLDRFAQAAFAFQASHYVRLTGDCPLIDPAVIDKVVALLDEHKVDYASNIDPPSFPNGLDCEAFSAVALEAANRFAKAQPEREHVTLWMRSEHSPFQRANLENVSDQSHIRLTVDYPEDLERVREVVSAIGDDAIGANLPSIMAHLYQTSMEKTA